MSWRIDAAERGVLPDPLIRFGIRRMLARRLRLERGPNGEVRQDIFQKLLENLRSSPIAVQTKAANTQHYEVPPAFFQTVLGKRLKYSCALYDATIGSLDEAEEAMLALTCQRAGLADGQEILELGCGWGSLTLWMAEKYPASRIVAVSNSQPQREHIESQLKERGWTHVEVVTCDMNDFATDRQFDRAVSIEMFEHMRNYELLMHRISNWLKNDGKLFVHVFCNERFAYPFEADGADDWMARHFFTGGIMPSESLLLYFQKHLLIERQWRVNGMHYTKTCEDWLANLDTHPDRIQPIFAHLGVENAARAINRWRLFFLACGELFAYRGGEEWFVSHYLFAKR